MSEPPIIPDEDPGPEVSGWNDSPVAGDRVDVHLGPIVAGDPDGARVEVAGDGLHAYDSTGMETAHIQGEGGEFVGGSFRTSDALQGQVTLSDSAYADPLSSGIAGPGVEVEPPNPAGFDRLPGIGPSWGGMTVSGGRDHAGRWATVETKPTGSTLRAVDESGGESGYISTTAGASTVLAGGAAGETGRIDASPTRARLEALSGAGEAAATLSASQDSAIAQSFGANRESGWMRARPGDAELAYVDPLNTYFSRIRASDTEAHLYSRAGGVPRLLVVDAEGVWVKTGDKAYNLEETAQDSGWQPFTALTGITTSGDLAWRNKNGVIYFRGYVTGSWAQGYQFLTGQLPPEMRPTSVQACMAPSSQDSSMMLRVHPTGRIDLNKPVAGSATAYLSGISYPLD